jgi:hypothetical protein
MEDRDGEFHVETDEARGASTENVGRWVLAIGLLLAIIGMSLAWILPAVNRDGKTKHVSVSGQINAAKNDGSGTDSVVDTNAGKLDAPTTNGSEGGVPTVANSQ